MAFDRLLRIVFLAFLAFVLFMTLEPSPPQIIPASWSDKVEHGGAFAVLALMARAGFRRVPDWLLLERLSFIGALIEVFQASSMVHRDCDWKDWVADTLGVVLALVAVRLLVPRLALARAIFAPAPAARAAE